MIAKEDKYNYTYKSWRYKVREELEYIFVGGTTINNASDGYTENRKVFPVDTEI